jgi:phytoene/squalene synthetase
MTADAIGADEQTVASAEGLRQYPAVALPSGCGCDAGGIDAKATLFRHRLGEIYAGALELPAPRTRSEQQHALHAFALTARRFDLPGQHVLDFAEGCRMELAVPRYATWAALERYCRLTGGSVALALAGVFGLTHSDAGEHAAKLGIAIRLTGILRDLKADRHRGRVYLPLEDLARFRYGERDLAAGVVNDAFRGLMKFEIARARQLYHEAAEGLCWVGDDRARLTAALLTVAHADVLRAIERHGYDIFTARRRGPGVARRLLRIPAAWRLARNSPSPLYSGERAGVRGPKAERMKDEG